jgi:hypothetical protein
MPERAVRAALAIQRGLAELEPQERRLDQARARRAHRDRVGAGCGGCSGRDLR